MGKYIKVFNNHNNYNQFIMSGEAASPNVSYCMNEKDVHYNPEIFASEYFTTVALESGVIAFVISKYLGTDYVKFISYSTDNGRTWITTNNSNNKTHNIEVIVNVSSGDKILWKGDATSYYNFDEDQAAGFVSTARFNVYGNIMSLLYNDNFINKFSFDSSSTSSFELLFGDDLKDNSTGSMGAKVVNAENLILPATTMVERCYYDMFCGCEDLMSVPKLPATTLAINCYGNMFYGCTSLTTAPELPVMALIDNCYNNMFQGCTSLTTAPALPATTLAYSCYYGMFEGCTNLITAPELPATTLAQSCYNSMFYGCTNLNYIKAMFTTTPSNTYTYNWVSGVASTGTFVKNSAAQWNVTGVNGIPTGWTVQTASN